MVEDMDVGMKCIKYMLFVANFMFVMIGFLLISIGTTVKAIYDDFDVFMAGHYFSPAALAVAIGVIIFFVALFGCVGAFKESTCLINLFALCMVFILILEIAASIAAYAMRAQIESTIKIKMTNAIVEYGDNRYIHDAWEFTQERLQCCGVSGADDWFTFGDFSKEDNTTIWTGPASCCAKDRHPPVQSCDRKNVWRRGCLGVLTYLVSESALLLGCGALAVAFIQVLGIVFAFMLAKAVRRLKTNDLVEREHNRQKLYEQLAKDKTENSIPTPVLYTPTFSEA